MSENDNYEVIAAVSVRSQGGVSLFANHAPVTVQNVTEFNSQPQDLQDAQRELTNLGFHVLQVNPSAISIAGSRKLFQEVFDVKLRKQKTEVMEGTEVEFMTVTGETEPQPLAPPDSLSNLIEGVALAEPPTFFGSPLPPIAPIDPAAYRYMFVPNEIGLVLNANRVHRMGATGKGIKIAMPDTGFYRHAYYSWQGYRVRATVLGPGASDPTVDLNGHGTGEAANIFAVSPDIELTPVKMGDSVGSFNAAVAQSPHVITNSWGYSIDTPGASLSPYLTILETAVANAVANGIVVCFAAGNGHFAFPGSHPDVISVGGVHVNAPFNGYDDLEASNYASSFDSSLYPGRHAPDVCGLTGKRATINGSIYAPSIMLPVQDNSSLDGITPSTGAADDGWGLFSGTSAATPQVAGVVALMLEKDPGLTPAEVKNILIKTATDVKVGQSAMGQPAGNGPDAATGAGLVSAKWAYINTMGTLAASFFEAAPQVQAQMLASGQMPHFTKEFVDDLLDTLRSTRSR